MLIVEGMPLMLPLQKGVRDFRQAQGRNPRAGVELTITNHASRTSLLIGFCLLEAIQRAFNGQSLGTMLKDRFGETDGLRLLRIRQGIVHSYDPFKYYPTMRMIDDRVRQVFIGGYLNMHFFTVVCEEVFQDMSRVVAGWKCLSQSGPLV